MRVRIAAAAVSLVLVAVPATSLAANNHAAPTWHVQAAQLPDLPNGQLAGVSCLTPKFCVGVGQTIVPSGGIAALAGTWNGTAWVTRPIPRPAAAVASELYGVSCQTADFCVAVGQYTKAGKGVPLVERWTGKAWIVERSVDPAGGSAILRAVSCRSVAFCEAVGARQLGASKGATLAESWNGRSWAMATTPNKPGGANILEAVSCSAVAFCVAVGVDEANTFTSKALAERWDGKSWSLSNALTPKSEAAFLYGVRCESPSWCVAVGTDETLTSTGAIERWNGKSWSMVATSLGPGELEAVSCASTTSCVAVGYVASSPSQVTLAASWNGHAWSAGDRSIPHGDSFAALEGVACSAPGACVTVGRTLDVRASTISIAQTLHGTTWAFHTAPNPPGRARSQLAGVACPSSSCLAVGSEQALPFSEFGSSTAWTIRATPEKAGSTQVSLAGIACPTPTSCLAVGNGPSQTTFFGVVEDWNGTAWKLGTIPSPAGAIDAVYSSISCPSSTTCVAVGFYQDGAGVILPLAAEWASGTWSVMSVPVPAGAQQTSFAAVSCATSSSCMAVGNYFNASFQTTLLVESLSANTWKVGSAPIPGGSSSNSLSAVSCSGTRCAAVGTTNASHALSELWDGTSWSVRPVASPAGSRTTALSGVSCWAATSCVAVGDYESHTFAQLTLAERWNGTAWSLVATPNPPGSSSNTLNAVVCGSLASCTAVGASGSDALVVRSS